MREKTVSVNGTVYDMRTGKPLRLERSAHPIPRKASDIHSHKQHSRTLNRKYVKKAPLTVAASTHHTIESGHKTRSTNPAATHHDVKRFSSDMTANKKFEDKPPLASPTIVHHPVASAAIKKHSDMKALDNLPKNNAPKPSDVLKKEAIAEATAKMPARQTRKAPKLHKAQTSRNRRMSIASAGLAFMMFSGYLTYLYMPNLSTRVAAAQAGIQAEYPAYHPSGYRLDGPVAYQPGEVSMRFAANAGPASYTLTQKRSAWDSSAVLENYITPKARDNYSTTQANGLTIYNYATNSAWVNGGILYTIEGDAPLSTQQIQRIAKSL